MGLMMSLNHILAQEITISPQQKWSERMALSVMKRAPEAWQIDNASKAKWEYKPAFVALAFNRLYHSTSKKIYWDYAKNYADKFIDSIGNISNYSKNDYNLDLVSPGKILFDLYQTSQDIRYQKALQTLASQLDEQPKTVSGGFWHKKIYPNQMWLDGLFMSAPFLAQYAVEFKNAKGMEVVMKQFQMVQQHFFDTDCNLPFHAWDESKAEKWSNPKTGTSPTVWSRATGWYMMALVDALDYFPKNSENHQILVKYLQNLAKSTEKQQDQSGLWFQVTNKNAENGNFLEASGTAMFTYAFAKGVNKGYLSKKYLKTANKAFQGMLKQFVSVDSNGEVHLSNNSSSVGLGGNPYRDGSFGHYVKGQKSIDNSVGVAAFILSAIELSQ